MNAQELIKEDIEQRAELEFNKSVIHGVHMECQQGQPVLIAQCGWPCTNDEREDDSDMPECPICWLPNGFCVVCGIALNQ